MDNNEDEDRIVTAFFLNICVQLLAYFNFWLDWCRNLFRFRQNGQGFQPRSIINSLIENIGSEEIKLIQANETAEDAFERKIRERDYESAKKLAKKFDFDYELIYQSMWTREKIDRDLIRSCLGASQNLCWILEQCCNHVPTDYSVLKELLNFAVEKLNQNPLDKEDKDYEKFNRYRNVLLLFNKRLKLYEMILQRRHGEEFSANFQTDYFSIFRFKSSFELSIEFANQSQIDALEILLRLEMRTLRQHLLTILSNVPETLPPSDYRVILDMLFDDVRENSGEQPEIDSFEESILQSSFEQKFYEENNQTEKINSFGEIDKNILIAWFQERSIIIAEFTMLIDNSLSLLNIGINHHLPELEDIFIQMDIYSMLVYEGNSSQISFTEFRQMELVEKMNMIFEHQDPIYALEVMFEQFLNKIKQLNKPKNIRKELLHEFVIKLAKNDFRKCAEVFRNYSMADRTIDEISKFKGIGDAIELIELALSCLRTYTNHEDLELAFEILTCLPDKSETENLFQADAAKRRAFMKINEQVDQLEDLLTILDVLQNYNTKLTLSSFEDIINKSDNFSVELFLEQVLQNFCNIKWDKNVDLSIEWKNFYWNLQDFRKKYIEHKITHETMLYLSVKCLLFSGKIDYIRLAVKHISFSPNRLSDRKLSEKDGRELLRKAAFDYIKFSNPNHDSNLDLAELCMNILLDNGENDDELREEFDLVKGVQLMLQDFDYCILPMKIKQIPQPRIILLEGLLSDSPNNYTKITKLLKLAQLLRVYKDHSQEYREGKVVQIIGEEALRQRDFSIAIQVCELVLERNLEHGWELCKIVGRIDDLPNEIIDKALRLRLLSFALSFCPESDLQAHIEILNHIRNLKLKSENDVESFRKEIDCENNQLSVR